MGDVTQQIGAFLKKNRFGVLCACTQEQPRATPVRYWSAGLTINVFSEKYTAKFHVLKKNRRVAFGIYNSRPVRGLQLWGKAEVITCEDPRHAACLPGQIKKNPRMRAAPARY